ncbi:MAG TPA: lysophospholipase [Blastocatellia bacterium]|nr:lysophospholipase [Blastocatellia bacterium]
MCYTEQTITSEDGLRLHVRRSEAVYPRAETVLVHGFGEHCGRYALLTEHLIGQGYSVTAYDHRGHGLSEGLRGHVDRFRLYEDDLNCVIASVRDRAGSRSLFIIGHSLGGLIALRYLASAAVDITGAVLSAPLLGIAAGIPTHKLLIAKIASRLAPRLRLDNGIDTKALSRDAEVGRAYAADPLVNRLVSARWFDEAVRAMQEAIDLAPAVSVPLLMMHGTEDRLASVEATRRCFEHIGASDKRLDVLEGFYHELFNEPEKNEVFAGVRNWLDARCAVRVLAAR